MAKLDFSIDTDSLMAMISQAPAAIQQAAESGIVIPPAVAKYAPLVGIISAMAGKVVKFGPQTGLTAKNEPTDIGPLGKGRQQYLRLKSNYKDDDVCEAFFHILDTELPGVDRVKNAVDCTLGFVAPGTSLDGSIMPSNAQLRESIDYVISQNAVHDENQCDKLGDLLNYTLGAMIKKRRALSSKAPN